MSIILVQFEAILLSTYCKIPLGYNVFEILLTSRLALLANRNWTLGSGECIRTFEPLCVCAASTFQRAS